MTTHSTDSTNSFDGAISAGLKELCAIVPNKTKAPMIPTKRFELNSPLSPLNISSNFFIVIYLGHDIFYLAYYFLNARPCFYAWALVATLQLQLLLPLPLSFNPV